MSKRIKLYLIVVLVLSFAIGSIASASTNNGQKTIVQKTEMRLEAAYSDIINSFKLESTLGDYKQIDFPNGINYDTEREIAQQFDALNQSPLGSTIPMYFLKKDLSEVIVLYKEADGTNVMKYAKRANGKWLEGEKRVKGSPILDIDKITD